MSHCSLPCLNYWMYKGTFLENFEKYSIYEIIFKILISSGLDVPTFE